MFDRLSIFYVSCVKWFALIASTLFFCLAVLVAIRAITLPHHTAWHGKERGAELDVIKAWNEDKTTDLELAPFECNKNEAEGFILENAELFAMTKYYSNITFENIKTDKELAAKWAACSLIRYMKIFDVERSLFTDLVDYAMAAESRTNKDVNPVLFLFTAADQYRLDHQRWVNEQKDFAVNYYGIGVAFGLFVSFVLMGTLLILVRIECNTRK